MGLKQALIVGVVAAEGELEDLAGPRRQVQELRELEVLAPGVGLAAPVEGTPGLTPVADRGQHGTRGTALGVPEVQDHRLTCGHEVEPFADGYETVRLAVVL